MTSCSLRRQCRHPIESQLVAQSTGFYWRLAKALRFLQALYALSAVHDQLRPADDQSSIGLILSKEKWMSQSCTT